MRNFFKRTVSFFLIPTTRWYLRKERKYTYDGVTVTIIPGVFHPGLFFSTKFLLSFLKTASLKGNTLLELGCGSGLISIVSAKAGAEVTASDFSNEAIRNVKINSQLTEVNVKIIYSDLFEKIDKQAFDWIIINPPYYAHSIENKEQLAWHCGEGFEYFSRLFLSLHDYMHVITRVIMVISDDCELNKIFSIADESGFEFILLKEKKLWTGEKNFIYEIKYVNK